jgi:uncharacterized protein
MNRHALTLWLNPGEPGALAASLSLDDPWARLALVSFCVLVGMGAVSLLRRRQAAARTRLTAGGLSRLGMMALVGLLISLGGVGVAYTRLRAYALVHPGRHVAERTPEMVGLTHYAAVSFASTDGLTLRGWYVPPSNGAVIIYVHGFSGNRSAFLEEAALLAGQGYGALLFDLRNSGESEGNVTTLGLREVNDVRGAVNFVLAQPGVDARRLGLVGVSMGGATAILSAARIPQISAVVAESTYPSLEDSLGVTFKQMTGLPPFPFAPLVIFFGEREAGIKMSEVSPVAEIGTISPRPILLVHGGRDTIMPVSNALVLYAAAQAPKALYLAPQAGHGDFMRTDRDGYARRLLEFLKGSLLRP